MNGGDGGTGRPAPSNALGRCRAPGVARGTTSMGAAATFVKAKRSFRFFGSSFPTACARSQKYARS